MNEKRRGAAVDLRVGEHVELDNGRVRISLEHKAGKAARLRIVADDSVRIVFPKRGTPVPA